jgi:hypothetical protein
MIRRLVDQSLKSINQSDKAGEARRPRSRPSRQLAETPVNIIPLGALSLIVPVCTLTQEVV